MRRFIRYLYEYEQGRRLRNVGFVKAEQGERECTLHIHGKGLHMKGERKLTVYLFFEEGDECVGIWQGTVDNVNPAINYRLYYTEEDAGGPENFRKINGMLLESELGHKYAAVWDDSPVNIGRMRTLNPTRDSAAPGDRKAQQEEAVPQDSLRQEETVLQESAVRQGESSRREEAMPQGSSIRQGENVPQGDSIQREETVPQESAAPGDRKASQVDATRREKAVPQESAAPQDRMTPQGGSIRREEAMPHESAVPQGDSIRREESVSRMDAASVQEVAGDMPESQVIHEAMQEEERVERDERAAMPGQRINAADTRYAERDVIRGDRKGAGADRPETVQEGSDQPEGQISREEAGREPKEPHRTADAVSQEACGQCERTERIPQCTKIQRNDLARLPRCEWKWANNSFLLHGYYNYHHLALLNDGSRYLLGVPGIYHPQEAKAANVFGFTEFIPVQEVDIDLTDDERNSQEQFGYWCRQVKRPLKM